MLVSAQHHILKYCKVEKAVPGIVCGRLCKQCMRKAGETPMRNKLRKYRDTLDCLNRAAYGLLYKRGGSRESERMVYCTQI